MAIYRDQVSRITLPMIRAQMKPTRFREAKSIRLEKFGFEAEVKLLRVASPLVSAESAFSSSARAWDAVRS